MNLNPNVIWGKFRSLSSKQKIIFLILEFGKCENIFPCSSVINWTYIIKILTSFQQSILVYLYTFLKNSMEFEKQDHKLFIPYLFVLAWKISFFWNFKRPLKCVFYSVCFSFELVKSCQILTLFKEPELSIIKRKLDQHWVLSQYFQ